MTAWNKNKKGWTNNGSFKKGHKINIGRICPEEVKEKIGKAQRGNLGNSWRGGVSSENEIMRKRRNFRIWREAIFKRDNFSCQKCKASGGYLHPHHINNFAEYIDLRFSIDNGITLCKKCHLEFHKKYGFRNNTKEQIMDFLGFNKDALWAWK